MSYWFYFFSDLKNEISVDYGRITLILKLEKKPIRQIHLEAILKNQRGIKYTYREGKILSKNSTLEPSENNFVKEEIFKFLYKLLKENNNLLEFVPFYLVDEIRIDLSSFCRFPNKSHGFYMN